MATSARDAPASKPKKPPRAALKISGYGVLGNRELKRILTTLELSGRKPEFFYPSFIEDAALILSARVKRDGFLAPKINIQLELENGTTVKTEAAALADNPLPRPLRIRKAHFSIHKGKLYHYVDLEFDGLETLTEKEARAYFVETGTLIHLKRSRIYTPEKLKHGITSLTDVLERQGYEQASAKVSELKIDDSTGLVRVRISVSQGIRSLVQSDKTEIFYPGSTNAAETNIVHPFNAYSRIWLQDFEQGLKTNQFRNGYPDAAVETHLVQHEDVANARLLELETKVFTGPAVRIGEVQFKGQKKTRLSLLSRRVRVERGELLDRIKVENGRYRLAQLGSFSSVDLTYEPVDETTRNVVYTLKEGKSFDVSLLFGYGSYELLRGGVETEAYNLWGLAHHARLKAVQSFKASSADFTYTVPEFVGRDIDLFFNASGLRREEISFTRLEYGGGFGGHRYFTSTSTDVSVRYNYQILNASDVPGVVAATEGVTNTSVGSIIFDLKHDRRDNPLYPREGYKVFANLEVASEYLAGDVNYQRLELATSYHRPLGGGRYLAFGLSHGVVFTVGSTALDLPFNRRFFPGGENSIRGFQEGQASPRDALGKIVGAESYALGTVEFEQSLTPKWSVVLFSDNLGIAERVRNYPFDTGLFSVGGGLRWKTLVGPVRLEYGHNLNPRPRDPSGTIQFSLGFPF